MYTGFMWAALTEINHLEVLHMYGQIILECILQKHYGKTRSVFTWLRTRTSGRLL
jgi:hypothetical protein